MGWSVNDVIPRSDGPENLKILKKSQLAVDFWPCRLTVGLSASMTNSWIWGTTMKLRSWGLAMVLRSWVLTMKLRNWDWTTRYGERLDVVSIVWLRKTFKNCVSLPVSKNRNQKLINGSYLNIGKFACVFAYVNVLLLSICLWLWLYNSCQLDFSKYADE